MAHSSARKAVLAAAGLALAGGAVAGPAVSAAHAAPAGTHVATQAAVAAPKAPEAKPELAVNAAPAKALPHDHQLQPNYYYCGPAATRIALSADGHAMDMDAIAAKLGTTTDGTNSAEDITRVLNGVLGGDTYKMTTIPGPTAKPAEVDKLKADVVRAVDGGRAVVANIAGTATDIEGGSHSFEGGHYLTVVGYSDKGNTVEIADPANPAGAVTYKMTTDTLANWIATRGYAA
nr:C39 family peptidase [Micromonospora pattaloongensis]